MSSGEAVNKREVDSLDGGGDLEAELKARPRSPTLLNLKWWAERFQKAAKIKTAVAEGRYSVDTNKLAQALLNREQ